MLGKPQMIFCLAGLFLLAGCATGANKDLEIQALKNQVGTLEIQLQAKNEEIGSLQQSLESRRQEKESLFESRKTAVSETKSRPSIRQIQTALKNAGYNPGVIDGKMGKQTRQAIKAFQAANNLKADGRVGKETWTLLRKYLYQKVK